MNKIISGKLPHLLAALAFFVLISLSYLLPLPEAAAQTSRDDFDINQGLTQNLGCTGFDCQLCHLVTLFNRLISFFIYAGTIAAIFIMAWVGLKYILSGGNPSATSEAKKIFWNVIWGFVIMLCAYLFIDTVLKTVLRGEAQKFGPWNAIQCVDLSKIGGTGGTGTGGGTVIPVTGDEAAVRQALRGIPINKGPCPEGVPYTSVAGGCTNVGGLPQSAISGIINFNNACGGCVTITGGSEGGHAAHGSGNAVVDISRTPSALLYAQGGRRAGSRGNDPIYVRGSDRYVIEGNHIHIEFGAVR